MAERRMISKVISISERVNTMPDIFDMLLFTWMIPHTDDFGRLAGSPGKIKALVVPMLDKTMAEISASLQRLHDEGLINWYEVGQEKIIQIINFDKHQPGLHKRTKPKFPDFPGTSGNFLKVPPEGKGREENLREEKGIEGKVDTENPDGSTHNPFRTFENGFGTISPIIADNLKQLSTEYGDMWLCKALELAVLRGKRTMKYVEGILQSWHSQGLDEPWKEETNRGKHEGHPEGVRHGGNQTESEFAFLDRQNRTGN